MARSASQVSISNRPQPESVSSSSSVAKAKNKKGKERQTRRPSAPSPPPEPTHQVAEETQAEGPLGAPSLTTNDPQILLQEADEEEESDVDVETTPGGSERWDNSVPAENMRGPHFGIDGADEFQNVWGR